MMIRTLILFGLITMTPSSGWDNLFEERTDESCSRFDFLDYLRKSGLPQSSIENDFPVFGPQLPAFYESYRRHSENESNKKITNKTTTGAGRVTQTDDVSGENRLEADLDRLLAQENRVREIESGGGVANSSKDNSTSTVDQQQQVPETTDPPLPSFNEWTKQKLEEQQQTKHQADVQYKNGVGNGAPATPATLVGSTPEPAPGPTKVTMEQHHQHARNYASKECGAKVLLANSQAQHASSVLNEKEPDEYMLIPCNAEQKFFVVELCETVQITRLDLANFELFSSSPKDFRVFVAERYPSTEWTHLGSWTAQDSRKIQNFPVERRVYAKYVKVELLSHYGSEHFCPLSLIRVLGVSVVEEYEAEAAQVQRQQLLQPPANGALQSEALGEEKSSTPEPTESAETESPTILEAPTTPPPDTKIAKELLTSAKDVVVHLAKGVIGKAQAVFGVSTKNAENETNPNSNATVESAAPPTTPLRRKGIIYVGEHWRQCLTCDVKLNGSRALCGYVRAFLVKKRPKNQSIAIPTTNITESVETNEKQNSSIDEEIAKSLQELFDEATKLENNQTASEINQEKTIGDQKSISPTEPKTKSSPPIPPPPSTNPTAIDASALPGMATSSKETVFFRLNNRIRNLETNISLSGEYLGELSLRYRKQMDEMQKALNRSNNVIAQHTKSTEEKLTQYRAEIELLQAELDKLKSMFMEQQGERGGGGSSNNNNETTTIGLERTISNAELWAPVIAAVEIVVLVSMVMYCCRGKSSFDERALDDAVDRRVRQAVTDELQKLRRNGVNVFGTTTGNGHVPADRSEEPRAELDRNKEPTASLGNYWCVGQNDYRHSAPPSVPDSFANFEAATVAVSNKPKKKAKKRQQQQQQKNIPKENKRKTSDQTPAFSGSRKENNNEDESTLNDSAAGILFSTSSPLWRRVLPNWRRSNNSTNQQGQKSKRRSSDDRLSDAADAKLNPRSKRKFRSQNAFDVLASSSAESSASESQNRSPEKRPRAGRGPS